MNNSLPTPEHTATADQWEALVQSLRDHINAEEAGQLNSGETE